MAYFECIVGNGGSGGGGVLLTVTCNSVFAGSTITCTDGTSTFTATCPSSSPYTVEFELNSAGIWSITGVYSGDTFTAYVDIPSAVALDPVPDGATVTPTDDIQIWLNCANIWDKAYTTIAQVLNDSTTLTALIASNNAADYMARSTTWASSVVANSSAMTKIGANNYCADALLANSTWSTAICNSTYYESVLNVKVPTMTSATTPSGEVSGTGGYTSSFPLYYAFDNNDSTYTRTASDVQSGTKTNFIIYKFDNPVCIKKLKACCYTVSGGGYSETSVKLRFKISNDGTNFSPIYEDATAIQNTNLRTIDCPSNNVKALYIAMDIIITGSTWVVQLPTLQYYGRA